LYMSATDYTGNVLKDDLGNVIYSESPTITTASEPEPPTPPTIGTITQTRDAGGYHLFVPVVKGAYEDASGGGTLQLTWSNQYHWFALPGDAVYPYTVTVSGAWVIPHGEPDAGFDVSAYIIDQYHQQSDFGPVTNYAVQSTRPHAPVVQLTMEGRDAYGYYIEAVIAKNDPGDDASGGGMVYFREQASEETGMTPIYGDAVYPVTIRSQSGLEFDHTYDVFAIIADQWGESSAESAIVTQHIDYIGLDPPSDLTEVANFFLGDMHCTELGFTWTAPDDPWGIGISGYHVTLWVGGMPQYYDVGEVEGMYMYALPNADYQLDVQTVDSNGVLSTPATITGHTAAAVWAELHNPSFEHVGDMPIPTVPAGWEFYEGHGDLLWDTSTHSDGNYSMKFRFEAGTTAPYLLSDFFWVSINKTYFLEADLKSSVNPDTYGLGFSFRWYSAPSESAFISEDAGNVGSITDQWAHYHAAGGATPVAGARACRLKLYWSAVPGSLSKWIDNLQMKPEIITAEVKDRSITTPKIALANVTADELATTGVSGGTYLIPKATVNTVGQWTGAVDQAGTSFPGSPSDNQFYYRTDLGVLCQYKSLLSNWLGTGIIAKTLHDCGGVNPTSFTTDTLPWKRISPPSPHAYYLVGVTWSVRVQGTNNAQNY
ncbi:MAG TPA: hypothetical protein VIY48_16605, partial [Candidatus Paceibacterota bacterium]